MKSTNRKDVAEFVGITAIVASLIFVGLQMKQSQDIALSAAYQARTDTLVGFLTAMATDELVRSAMEKNASGIGELTKDERFAATTMITAGIELMQNSHYQYLQGYLDEEHWQSMRMLIKGQLQTPIFRELLLDGNVRSSFKLVIDEIDGELRAESE